MLAFSVVQSDPNVVGGGSAGAEFVEALQVACFERGGGGQCAEDGYCRPFRSTTLMVAFGARSFTESAEVNEAARIRVNSVNLRASF